MRYLGWLIKLALFGLVVVFLAKNVEPVTVRYYLGGEWQAPLFLVLSLAFLAGVVIGVAAGVAQFIRQRREITALRRELGAAAGPAAGGAARATL
jgi:lipopolysaccharide assembly protein A